MALAHPVVERLPMTPTIVYLLVGLALGPLWFGVMQINPIRDTKWLLHASEIAVVISLFTVGMKLRLPIRDPQLRPALFLASVSMVLTIGLVTGVGVWLLGLPLGVAVLLGGILAPTDPVLASDVQMRHPLDRDKLRLTLSAEAGLNDGTAFPFVILGLGLLGVGEANTFGLRWLLVDGLWAVSAGIAIGGLIGYGTGRLVLRLNTKREDPLAFGEYLVLGVIGVTYALAVLVHSYGFLAVFAAGVALRAAEQHASGHSKAVDDTVSAIAEGRMPKLAPKDSRAAPAYFAGALLATNEQLERILEVALVLIVGAMVATVPLSTEALWFAALLFLVIRPIAALPVRAIRKFTTFELGGIAWFGIRGIGSVYYLMYAVDAGLPPAVAERIASLVLSVIVLSILVHGISVTPLLNRYAKEPGKRGS